MRIVPVSPAFIASVPEVFRLSREDGWRDTQIVHPQNFGHTEFIETGAEAGLCFDLALAAASAGDQ